MTKVRLAERGMASAVSAREVIERGLSRKPLALHLALALTLALALALALPPTLN